MPPPRASSADSAAPPQTPAQIAAAIEAFLAEHSQVAVMEDGKILFDLASDKWSLSTEHGCTLHLWNEERNLVRKIVSAAPRAGSLRMATRRLGHAQPKVLELISSRERRTPATRDAARARYLRLLQRVLTRNFPDWRPDGLRNAMDLERSFGPAYTRGTLLRGTQAWAVIGVDEHESVAIMEGILTLGVLWLHYCREQAGGRRLYQGLKVIVPRGAVALTLARMGWLNKDAAQWEMFELNQASEELTQHDLADRGNLRTRLVHRPDDSAAAERFSAAIAQILTLVPPSDHQRVEHRLRSSSELGFLLHGLEFARARISLAQGSFAHTLEITVGTGGSETLLTPATREELAARVSELFERRNILPPTVRDRMRSQPPSRRIGEPTLRSAHSRLPLRGHGARSNAANPMQDPLYRAAPERWLESVLRQDLAPLTRALAPAPTTSRRTLGLFANDPDPDTRGNRADVCEEQPDFRGLISDQQQHSRVLPRLDPRHVYAQVPAIAGASDRGLLDLLGVTADGRLAVLELKADDDLHFALQGLDYWIRVRHHHLQTADPRTGLGEFQRHGYFRGVELSPLPPRLYLVAPALHIHPATETVLRYFSPTVEWHLLALDERWRQQVRVVWRKSSA